MEKKPSSDEAERMQWLWGKESLKQRLVQVAIALPFALLAGILQWVGNSTHNDLLGWTGMVISCMLGSLVIITLILTVVIRERQKAREQERQKPFRREQRKIPRQVEAIARDVGGKISAEDWRLIEANQLGAPVGRYGVRQSAIGVFRWSSLGVIFGGLVILLLAGTHIFTFSDASFLSSFAPWGIGLLSVLVGIATLPVSLILLPKQCVLVCENGFLQRTNTRSRIVRWNDIWAIRQDSLLSEIYHLDLQTDKGVALGSYEHLDELVELIRQRSGLA